MSDPNFPPDERNAELPLWRRVREFICELFNICGDCQQLATKHTLTFRDYKVMLPWIRAGEALIRRFLLIEAALLPQQALSHGPPACPPKLQRRRAPSPASSKHARKPAQQDLDPDNPASWRVSFRTTVAERRLPGGIDCSKPHQPEPTQAPHAGWKPALRSGVFDAPKFRAALPLARRLEAMLRVYNNPMPFVRRLAARIRKTASLIKRVLADAWDTSRGIIPHLFHEDLGPCIAESARLLTDSS